MPVIRLRSEPHQPPGSDRPFEGTGMSGIDRRSMMVLAAALGAGVALPSRARAKRVAARESRERFPEGVASADPTCDTVILWTRRPPFAGEISRELQVEIAEEENFENVVAKGRVAVLPQNDYTCRFLGIGLLPGRTYWYRFIDDLGYSSRIGRTRTAHKESDERDVCFAFVSCQNVNLGYSTPFRMMIDEDLRSQEDKQIQFVLHLGDFIYEMVWYPEDRPEGMQGREVRGVVRLPSGEKVGDYHIPTCVDDYRAIYRAYLADPDIQDARARWPFICVWDNHEFSNRGWQSQVAYDRVRPAQSMKVAANRVWYEYVPARVLQPTSGLDLQQFHPPVVQDAPLTSFDSTGLSLEPNNLKAVNSLIIARDLTWGRHVSLVLTDNRSYRSEPPLDGAGVAFGQSKVPFFVPQDSLIALDAGRTFNGGQPPETIRFGGRDLPNPRRERPAGSMLGAVQKDWFLKTIRESKSTWVLWGNSVGMLDLRADLANLPPDLRSNWPTEGFGVLGSHDWSAYATERAEILRAADETGARLVSLVGDRHAFYAGTLSTELPPRPFRPVAVEFVTGSICTPTVTEAAGSVLVASNPLSALILNGEDDIWPALNITLRHGVQSALVYQRTHSKADALAVRNPKLAPHLNFADAAGHGYSVVSANGERLEVTFVATPAPRSPDKSTTLYHVIHRVQAWSPGETPRLSRTHGDGPAWAERFLDWEA